MSRRAISTLMATAIMAASTPAAASATSVHQIQPGDTLTQIAERYGLSIDDLILFNNIENPNVIYAGDDLRLSEMDESANDPGEINVGDTVYEIRTGDTLLGIAIAHGVSLSDLIAINEIEHADTIYAGDFLIIPTSPARDGSGEEQPVPDSDDSDAVAPQQGDEAAADDAHIVGLHLVARGETLSNIALRYGVTLDQLARANDIAADAMIYQGDLLRIPDPSWVSGASIDTSEAGPDGSARLEKMPVQKQSLSLSAEAASLSMVTNYWGHQVSEWVFIENMPYHPNPHRGFRGEMSGQFGGTSDYGVYARPLSAMLANYGFVGEEFYTMGNPDQLRARIDRGQPVLVWMTNLATPQERFYQWYQGERFTLVPQQHVVVAYGYDEENIYVADPGNGDYGAYSWDVFTNSWSLFDGMSMAVYPKG